MDEHEQTGTDASPYDYGLQVADAVEALVAAHLNGYPDPETTPTLQLLEAIDTAMRTLHERLAAVEAERDALRAALEQVRPSEGEGT